MPPGKIITARKHKCHFVLFLRSYGHVVDEMKKASSNRMQKLIDSMSM